MTACPVCGVNHRRFPYKCYGQAYAEYTDAVIIRLPGEGMVEKQRIEAAAERWNLMYRYMCKRQWFDLLVKRKT